MNRSLSPVQLLIVISKTWTPEGTICQEARNVANQAREKQLQDLKGLKNPSVLIVGGGINGIGLYRDLVLQGIDVLLVERNDFCSGASAALSRMIHGGLRYLEQGEFRLVRESLEERNALLRNAPHYVSPLPTTIPIFDYASGVLNGLLRFLRLTEKPGKRGAFVIKLGLSLYDFFTRARRETPTHRFRGRQETFRQWPDFHPDVKCSATYYDAWVTYPERLGLEMIMDVDQTDRPCAAINYVSVANTYGSTVTLKDEISGEEFPTSPTIVVNATGAWIDLTNDALQNGDNNPVSKMVGGTKGSHLIIRNDDLLKATGGQMVYYENQDGRICILFPYFGNVLVGSTDIKIDDPTDVRCEEDERDYILQSLTFVFPKISIKQEEILYTFSGVRPLVHSDASVTGGISRDHVCRTLPETNERPFPVLCMIGGKWTTFRAFGEQVSNQILSTLNKTRRCSTIDIAIGGGKGFAKDKDVFDKWINDLVARSGLDDARLRKLAMRYGTATEDLIKFLQQSEDHLLANDPSYSQRELLHIIEQEHVVTLEDILLRRTALGISGNLSSELIDEVLQILAQARGWLPPQIETARSELLGRLASLHAVTLSSPSRQSVNP
jgi:glycerol-3-phosphate dehydrogenase